jgi:hypothetical protein
MEIAERQRDINYEVREAGLNGTQMLRRRSARVTRMIMIPADFFDRINGINRISFAELSANWRIG